MDNMGRRECPHLLYPESKAEPDFRWENRDWKGQPEDKEDLSLEMGAEEVQNKSRN